jgi:hypothetical protein
MRLLDVVDNLQCIKSKDGRHEWIQENRLSYKCTKRGGAVDEVLD